MKHTGIYRIRNLLNGKIYIGQGTDIFQRWRQHRHRLTKGSHDNRHLQAAWKQYGADAFAFEIILECPAEMLGALEIAELTKVPENLRYNLGPAGDNPTRGSKKRFESKLQQSRSKGGRPFFQKNVTTGEVTRFEYVGEVSEDPSVREGVRRCLRNDRTTHLGFAYFYDHDFVPTPFVNQPRLVEKRNREVIGTEIATGRERHFAFVAKVQENNEFQRTGVIKCLSGEMQTHRGFTWRYADGLPHKTMSKEARARLSVGARARGGSRAVIGTNTATGEEKTFPYVRAAAKELGITAPFIHHVLAGRMLQAGGYTWRYADGKPHNKKGKNHENDET